MVKGATLVPTKSCRELLNLYEIDYSVTFTRVSLDFKKNISAVSAWRWATHSCIQCLYTDFSASPPNDLWYFQGL